MEQRYGADELVQHLEVVRFVGRIGFASLALLRPGTDAEAAVGTVEEVMRWHEANGIPVFNPHTHVLEDGGMKETDWAQLGFKRRVDPSGVLNPGKMRAWEEQGNLTAKRKFTGGPGPCDASAAPVAPTGLGGEPCPSNPL